MSNLQTHAISITHYVWRCAQWIAIAALSSLGGISTPALAQSITATTDGTGTVITIDGNTYHIQGGTQAGANLFHSFQGFGLSAGEIANFLSDPGITNILGRVMGGEPSVINGLLQVTGSNANLYLMNPAGILFGPNASLNVSGDFFATTADQIDFAGGTFNAIGSNDYTRLVGTPNQFSFTQTNPTAIINQGTLQNTGDINLIGGTIIHNGDIVSTQGNITLAAIPGTRLVNLAQPGMLLSLDLPDVVLNGAIAPSDLPHLLTGQVEIHGLVQGEQVDLYASGQVVPIDPHVVQGDTRVIRFSETGENPDQAVFIDARADDPEALLYGAVAGTVAQIIESDEDGVSVISEQLAVITESVGKLESVAIVAEGNAGNFWLGNQWLRSKTIGNYATQLQTWGDALTQNADLLLYSCFTALGETGEALVASIANFTGADVAASVDVTGSANDGGNWSLETSTGDIETSHPFTSETLATWEGKLNTLTVDSATDDGVGFTLRDALNAANNDITVEGQTGSGTDTILFDTGGVFAAPQTITTATAMGEFSITDDVIIEGTGQANLAIEGTAINRVFNSSASNVTFRKLTIRNGTATSGAGGGIHQAAGRLTLENITISDNSTNSLGGGIFVNGNVILTQSTVSGNSAGSDGGGIFSTNNITLNQSTIANNRANDAGGLYSPADVMLTNSMITSNSATVQGGGADVRTTLSLSNSTVSGNTAGSSGGGLFLVNTNLTLTNSTISNNSATNLGGGIADIGSGSMIINNSTIADNLSDGVGGGITTVGTLELRNGAIVSGNSAALRGGGIFIFGNSITANDSRIENNLAGQSGGGIYSNSDVQLTNSTISGNSATLSGGGIYSGGTATLTGSTVVGNSTGLHGGGVHSITNITIDNSTVDSNSAMNNGGGVYSDTGDITVTNSIITNNSANFYGGGISAVGNVAVSNSTVANNSTGKKGGGIASIGNTTITGSSITNNLANEDGGGIATVGNITIDSSTISGNSSGRNGGGAYSEGGTISLINSTVSSNSATDNGGGLHGDGDITVSNSVISGNSAISAFGDGGGIFGKSAVTLSSATLSTNVAGDEGGGVWAQGDIDVSASTILSNSALGDDGGGIASIGGDITVNSSLLSGNSAGDDGGGLESGTGNVAIANSTLSSNVAGQDGGGIDSNFGSITLTNAIVSGNSATRSGGGIYSNGDVTLSGSTVSGNTTFFDGGGIRSRGNVTVTNAVIMDNISTFDDGGGIAGDGDITVNNSTIANNFASRNGGGLYSGGTTTISGSTISENTAINDGGGFYSSGDITVTNSTFSGNVAEDGGGIRNRANVTITNSTLSGNSALRRGGAIHSFGGAVTLLNATIAFNAADLAGTGPGDGGGIYVTGIRNNQIANSIIASNLGPGGNASDFRADLSSSTVQNSLIQSTLGITGITLMTGVNGNIIGQNPLLAPLANNGGNTQTHALLSASPALDAGDNGLLAFILTTDQAGRSRILDGTVDIGAFEGIVTDLLLPTTPSGTPPTATPTPTDLNPLTPLNTLEQISRETVGRDRVSTLLANNQICEAAATLDQYHTQSFAQHFGRFQAEKAISCAQMQQRLADDSALLYVFAQTDKLHLISLTSEDDPSHYELPLSRDAVFAELTQFQHTLTNPILRRSENFLASAQRLYQWIIPGRVTEGVRK
ncbi:MAG: DUF4347 domain-containing protein [Spirulina sp. SIO3F2]|nr:DUF4347 domain-containing protein [Spirulina sp. SIO3F2]